MGLPRFFIMDEQTKLTDKQEMFCQEYIIDFNATRAAKAAGYSEDTATEQGSRLLTNVKVGERIGQLQKDRLDALKITKERILAEYARIAFLDVRKLFNDDGNIKPISEWDEDTARAIAGIDHTIFSKTMGEDYVAEELTKKIKMIDKKGALDSLAKHFEMFTDKVDLTTKGKEISNTYVIPAFNNTVNDNQTTGRGTD